MTHALSTKIIIISVCVLLTLSLVLGFISPVQAATEFPIIAYRNDSSLTPAEVRTYGTQFATSYYALQNTNSTISTYMFAISSESAYQLVCFCEPPEGITSTTISTANSSGMWGSVLLYQTYNGLLYGVHSNTFSDSPTVPVFESVEAGLNEYLNPTPEVTSSFNLPYGNVAIIDLNGITPTLDISTVFREKSALFGNAFSSYGYYGYLSTFPVSGQTFEQASSTSFSWDRGYPRDILGQTRNAISSIATSTAGRYLYIVNPYTNAPSPDAILDNISVSGIPSGVTVYKFPLSSSLSNYGNVIATLSDVNVGGEGESTSSGGAINFIDSNGDVYTSPDGGLNAPSESTQSVVNYINSISQTLDNFVESFLNLLKAPISHIQQLVSSGSAFMQSLSTMFTWLPEPVQAVITSGLVLLVVIGVLKLLL